MYKPQRLFTLPCAVIAGIIVYVLLSAVLASFEIMISISVVISLLIFGLTGYYTREEPGAQPSGQENHIRINEKPSISFIVLYTTLIVLTISSTNNWDIFAGWEVISIDQIIGLAAAILISLFAPGYAIVSMLDKKHELKILPKLLTAYLLSILVTGLSGYIAAYLGLPISNIQVIVGIVHLIILLLFVLTRVWTGLVQAELKTPLLLNSKRLRQVLSSASYKLLVFASLIAMVIISTYYIYDGKIIGDQWYYHGRSIQFLSGAFRDIAFSGIEDNYPPFSQAFLATFFALSGVPSVNAYVSISILNVMPLFAFYYFFATWVPPRYRKAALLASALFVLSSGYGWLYALNMVIDSPSSRVEALEGLNDSANKTIDIWVPNTFIIAGHPDIATALIIIALPAGFLVLGLTKENFGSRTCYVAIFVALTILANLSHPESGIFIILVSTIPIIFGLQRKDDVFIAILIALSLVNFLGFFFPGHYYTSRGIFGIPFITIYLLFSASMWAIYRSQLVQKIASYFRRIFRGHKQLEGSSVRLILGITAVCVSVYLYVLSFIIWYFQLPLFDIVLNTVEFSTIPWHFYPIRLGLCGALALAFIISYIFKKFEKEIFIFGIMAIVAFLVLPQYLEIRSNKYIMTAMVAFASLMLLKFVLTRRLQHSHKRGIYYGSIIGATIVFASMSTLMYIGYVDLGLNSASSLEEANVFDRVLPRRANFPSDSEMRMLDYMRSNLELGENVALTERELNKGHLGLRSWLEGFVGLPVSRLSQDKLGLGGTSLEDFYKYLDYTDTKFILLDKRNLAESIPLSFALDNFKRPYEDEKYVVLTVPQIESPSDQGSIALISSQSSDVYDKDPISSRLSIVDVIDFGVRDAMDIKDNATVLGPETQIWSNISKDSNYIESTSRTLDATTADGHHGILWNDGFENYYAFVHENMLTLITLDDGRHIKTVAAPSQLADWVTLKVAYINGMVNLFFNNDLKIQVPQMSDESHIARVGLNTWNSMAEFLPLKVGTLLLSEDTFRFGPQHKNDYYYALSALGLSQSEYDIFASNDPTALLAKKAIVLTSDQVDPSLYLEYVKSGGDVIILNSNNDFEKSGFTEMLCIEPLGETPFNNITIPEEKFLQVSGEAKNVAVYCPTSSVTSYYTDNGKKVAPFIIEREYGKGRVVFVNAAGYFEAISKNPGRYFQTLRDIPNFLHLSHKTIDESAVLSSAPLPHFIGNLTMDGRVTVTGSSVMFPKDQYLEAALISVTEENRSPQISNRLTEKTDMHKDIKDLGINGSYNVSIGTNSLTYVPSSSQYSYIPLSIPEGSDITIYLSKGSSAKFRTGDSPAEIHGRAKIEISDIKNTISLSVKSPEIEVNGKASFQNVRSHYLDRPTVPWVDLWPLSVSGKMAIKLDRVVTDASNVGRYITYFSWIDIDPANTQTKPRIYQGEILDISWSEILGSYYGTRTAFCIVVVGALAFYIGHSSPRVKRALS